jgi:valyl-tRNA synthetase
VRIEGEGLAERLRTRLEKRLADTRGELEKAERKLANKGFVDRAPATVVAEERERAERFGREAEALEAQLGGLA